MALFDSQVSLYDLLAPLSLGTGSVRKLPYTRDDPYYGMSLDEKFRAARNEWEEEETNFQKPEIELLAQLLSGVSPEEAYSGGAYDSGNVAYAEPPSRTDLFLDRAVGGDRYQDLGDEARRRALNDAIMSIGQSLGQAALAGRWSGPSGASAALMGMIPGAKGAFEKRLAGEEEYRQKAEDRGFLKEQREFAREEMGEKRKERKETEAGKQAAMKALPAVLDEAEQFMNTIQVDPGEERDVESAKSHLTTLIRTIRNKMKIGGSVSVADIENVENAKERLAKSAGRIEELHQKEQEEWDAGVREFARKIDEPDLGVAGKKLVEFTKRELSDSLGKRALDMESKRLQNELTKEQIEFYKGGTPPPETAGEGYQWIRDPNSKSGWRQARVPDDPAEKRDIYSENLIKDARENSFIKKLVSADFSRGKDPGVVMADPAALIILRQLGMNHVTPGYKFTVKDQMDLMNRLTVRPGASDRSPVGGIRFAGVPPDVQALYERARQSRPPFTGSLEEFYEQYKAAKGIN